ncbi:hypothetical protein ES705_38924 [subsurface metagenome]
MKTVSSIEYIVYSEKIRSGQHMLDGVLRIVNKK